MKIELKQQKSWKRWFGLSLFVVLIGYTGFALTSKATKSVPESSLTFQTVESGALDIYTSAYGEFASAKERLLTAPALGKVSEIVVRPGTLVSPNTVILKLSNPKLEQEVNEAVGLLAQQKAELEAFKYVQQNERLNYQGNIANIDAEIEKAQLELTVNEDLSSLGVASKIELQRAKLAVKQQTKRLTFEKQKFEQFKEMQSHQLTQRTITIEQQSSQVALLKQQLADMHVKSGITGSLQTLEVELGQSVTLGQSLAKVGSDKELIARIRLPQHQADQIDINAPVIIDTQKGHVSAYITRIESVVNNGTVLAEAVIDGELTSNARPSLAISANVFVKHDSNATYISQIPGLRPRSNQSVFVMRDNRVLQQTNITFGELSQNKLIVTNGLAPGDRIVSSDTSKYNQFRTLALTN